MTIDVGHLKRCIATLERALDGLRESDRAETEYDIFRAACVKEFELILEQSGKLLKMCLRPYFASNLQADRLLFRDIFREAARHALLSSEACERWLQYRDNRNDTAHEYGERFAEATLAPLPAFIADARALVAAIERNNDA